MSEGLSVKTAFSTPAGPGVLDYTLHTEEHKCKKDVLLGRMKHSPDKMWKLIRPRPTKTQYVGPYYICKGNQFIQKARAIQNVVQSTITHTDQALGTRYCCLK